MHPGADTRLRGLAGEPDERLVARVHAGDERAFDEIVTRYRAPLLRYVRRYLAPAAAEDAAATSLAQDLEAELRWVLDRAGSRRRRFSARRSSAGRPA